MICEFQTKKGNCKRKCKPNQSHCWQHTSTTTKIINCSICYEDIHTKNTICLPCSHTFCKSCISEWFFKKSSCPLCRESMILYSLTNFTRNKVRKDRLASLQNKFNIKYGTNIGTIFFADEVENLVNTVEELYSLTYPTRRYFMYPSKGINVKYMQIEGLYLPVYRKNKRSLDFYLVQHGDYNNFKEKYGIELCNTNDLKDWYILKGDQIISWEE